MRGLAFLAVGLLASGCSCGSAFERPDAGTDAARPDGGSDAGSDAASIDVGTDAGSDAAVACSGTLDCDDDDPCNGGEACSAGFCAPGTPLPDGTSCGTGGKGSTCIAGRCIPNP